MQTGPGPLNLITDVRGLRVGHASCGRTLSGVTVAVLDCDNVASGITRGGAPGTRDTTLLDPEMTATSINAVVLSGGSLFGLDAAGGVVNFLRDRGVGPRIRTENIPIAVQATTFDLLNGGDKAWGRKPPYWDLGWTAAEAASCGRFALGSVGGGIGATTSTFKGGVGSASMITASGYTVGALVVVNAVGSAVIGQGPHFWAAPYEREAEFAGVGLPHRFSDEHLQITMKGGAPPSTTIAMVATDAVLTKPQARRIAEMADDGLARAIRPAHAPMDGDTVFAIATQQQAVTDPLQAITEIGQAAADCLARAIARGVYEAIIPSPAYTGPPAWRDVHAAGSARAGG